jgi:serine/threonine protein kinase/WD40 repeat protein
MVRRFEADPLDHDEQLGEAIESYLALAEKGQQPEPEIFAARYPDLREELIEALEGLALVRGLVGDASGGGIGHRLESGRRIAGYRIVRELGRGGMGIVYEAVHVGLDRPVALKVLGAHAAPDSSGRRRFLNEARTAAGLHHTHIVPVFDVGQVGGLCYYAMQRIEGCGLDRVIRQMRKDRTIAAGSSFGSTMLGRSKSKSRSRSQGATPPPQPARPSLADDAATWGGREGEPGLNPDRDREDEPSPFDPPRGAAYYRWVAEIGRQAAEALGHAHQRGVIHRDVKPSNLLVDARGLVWVADFGLARRLADPGLTQHDSLLGTPRYMSPEQARTGPIDGRTDVYSLGATLYELLTLRPPFEGQSAAELVDQIGNREPSSPRKFDPRVPRDLETILLKALAKRPADRYATALDLAEDLERFLHLEPVRARRISPIGRLWRLARRHPGISIVSTAAALTVLTIATVAYTHVVHERDAKGRALEKMVVAVKDAQEAKRNAEAANRKTKDAMRDHLISSASVFKLRNVPNRREKGLEQLKQAAALDPDPALRARLRNEAVEFLVLHEVEAGRDFSTGRTRALVFTPEGNRLATVSDDGEELSLWDVDSRRRVGRHPLRIAGAEPTAPAPAPGPGNGPGGRNAGLRRPGGQSILAAAGQCVAVVRPDRQGLRLFDTDTGVIHDLELPGPSIQALHVTRDGRRLVTVEAVSPFEFRVNLWNPGPDVQAGRLGKPIATLAQVRIDASEPGVSPLVAITPDGKTVATARTRQTTVALWSTEDGHSLGQVDATAELTAMALGPDGLLATASGGAVQLWDIDTRTPRTQASLTPEISYTRLLRFNPEGTLLALAGMGSGIEIWDVSAHTMVAMLTTAERLSDLTFSPDGRTLAAAFSSPGAPDGRTSAAASGSATKVWTIHDSVAQVRLSGFDSRPNALAFRKDGLLAIGTEQGTLRFWQPGHCPSTLQPADGEAETAGMLDPGADHSPRNRSLALTFDDHDRLLTIDPGHLQTWSQPPKLVREERVALNLGRDGGRAGLNLSPPLVARTLDGRTLFIGRSGRIAVWHSDEPKQVRLLSLRGREDASGFDLERSRRGFGSPFWHALAASPTGDRLYLIDQANEVQALALDGLQAHRLDWKLPGEATSLALSRDGKTLAFSDRRGQIVLVDTARGTILARLRPASTTAEGPIRSLAFAPNGQVLAVGSPQGPIELWSLHDPSEPLLRLTGHRAPIHALAFDAEGQHLASAALGDQVIEVWDLTRIHDELDRLGLGW